MSVIEREQVPVEVRQEPTLSDVLLRAAYGYEEGLYGWHRGK